MTAPDATIGQLPPLPARVHFVGIGGIGMSGLARILVAWGYTVTGSDSAASPILDDLAAVGVGVTIGHTALEDAANADLVVMTAAVRADNPELVSAKAAGRPIVKRAVLLGGLMNARDGIAVAGSHGKSTTSGMLATALLSLGAMPSYAVGAVLSATGVNAAPGDGPLFVAEADEYDYSFLQLAPEIAIVTNIEYDHPDLFPDLPTYDAAFARFISGIRPSGALVIAGDDPGCQRLLAREDLTLPSRLVTFGEHDAADWGLRRGDRDWIATSPNGSQISLTLTVPGRHNARNALAALAALVEVGYPAEDAAAALATFRGVGRRFEFKGEVAGVTVIDDYAHHPSEIRATLAAARDRFPDRRLWAVFQPHTYSRLKALLPDFASSFADADQIAILDVYAAREKDTLGVSADDLRALLPAETLAPTSPDDAAVRLAEVVAPGDIMMTLGAGSVTETGPRLLALLNERSPETPAGQPPADPGNEGKNDRPSNITPATRSRRTGRGDGPAIPGQPDLKVSVATPMSLYTTWRVGGAADFLVRAGTPEALVAAALWGKAQGMPVTVLGGGSNLLIGDAGVRGLVILVRTPGERAGDLVQHDDLGDAVRLTSAAQAHLSWLGRYAAERGWSGLDWGVGLPGTIGGATVNNAGAHGTEQKDHLASVTLLDLETGELLVQPAAWLEPAYRHTRIKTEPRPRRWIVVSVTMLLPKGDPTELVRLANEHAEFRKTTQPGGACGGSTFANPPGDYAGRLLEAAGMKEFRIGGAAFSSLHANWIVNDRKASANDIRALIRTGRERVRERFGIELRQEIEEIGDAESSGMKGTGR